MPRLLATLGLAALTLSACSDDATPEPEAPAAPAEVSAEPEPAPASAPETAPVMESVPDDEVGEIGVPDEDEVTLPPAPVD